MCKRAISERKDCYPWDYEGFNLRQFLHNNLS